MQSVFELLKYECSPVSSSLPPKEPKNSPFHLRPNRSQVAFNLRQQFDQHG